MRTSHSFAPPNSIPFTSFSGLKGTWDGKCTQLGYVSPDDDSLKCTITQNEKFTYPFSVTFGDNNLYQYTFGTFEKQGRNESFTSDTVPMTWFKYSSPQGAASYTNALSGQSKCVSISWAGNSFASTFLATLVRSFGGYRVYLEEGVRFHSKSLPTANVTSCPKDSNLPHICDEASGAYSYTCYAILKL